MPLPAPCEPVRTAKLLLLLCLSALVGGFLLAPQIAAAQGNTAERATHSAMELAVGSGTLIRLSEPATSLFIASPDIADIQSPTERSVFVVAKKAGRTTLYALGAGDKLLVQRDIVVVHNTAQFTDQLRAEFPAYRVSLTSSPGRLVVGGAVSTPQDAEAIMALAKGYVGQGETVVNQLKVTVPTQVHLRVRVAEMARNTDNQFGIHWDSLLNPGAFAFRLITGRDFMKFDTNYGRDVFQRSAENAGSLVSNYSSNRVNLTAVIDALDAEGMVTILAEPNLTAASGQTASFLAGGEFPIPVAEENNRVSVVFKQFGIGLNFTPTVLSPERISLTVRPEVSELSEAGAVTIGSIQIPGLSVRRVETTVELGSGESFAIAGLLQNNIRDAVTKFPLLGDLPVLGPLFSSTRFRKNESELVVIVTPYLVNPAGPGALQTPLDGLRPTSELERLFARRLAKETPAPGSDGPVGPGGARLNGAAGFIY
ncbi:type II and III secretion system protein family protein [Azospirillum argentinense]